jgi:hypothetical protein
VVNLAADSFIAKDLARLGGPNGGHDAVGIRVKMSKLPWTSPRREGGWVACPTSPLLWAARRCVITSRAKEFMFAHMALDLRHLTILSSLARFKSNRTVCCAADSSRGHPNTPLSREWLTIHS